ncbi:transmembrane protein 268 isoform X1 [Helicoverpa zea]|uniref:transmembrane protein 268 isoform X1 n=1 Tax=Helicoverpa zea TaxID=7113 RepID=UPI001F5785AA|nr:transmembrane protein 268 isoform X1 [Helicoverpa zea]
MSNVEITEVNELNGNVNQDKVRKGWVKFDDESPKSAENDVPPSVSSPEGASTSATAQSAAVLKTETVHINLERGDKNIEPISLVTLSKNVEFVNVRQGFSNGDIIVTLLPVNTKWPWVTAAHFRPELVPEELMAQGLTLTVEEYVHAMELLINDARFTLYNICYKRVLVCWITLAFLVLLALLFSGLTGLILFSLGVLWLILNAAAIFLCMWIKLRLSKGLEQCLARVNKLLSKHKLILALDDRGKISCHKVNLCFIYFDSGPCIAHIQQFIESEEGKTIMQGWEQRLDVPTNDIVIQGTQSTRLSRKQGMAEQVYLRYLQRWGKDFLRRRLDWTLDEEGGNPAAPRHLTQALCPCQYVEEVLRNKEPRDTRACCPLCNDWLRRRGLD